MDTQTTVQPVTAGSFNLVWTLVTRSIGLTACVGVALLLVASLI